MLCPLQVLWGDLWSGSRLCLSVPGACDLPEEAGLAALAVGAPAQPAHPTGRGQPAGSVPDVAGHEDKHCGGRFQQRSETSQR